MKELAYGDHLHEEVDGHQWDIEMAPPLVKWLLPEQEYEAVAHRLVALGNVVMPAVANRAFHSLLRSF